MLRPGEIVVDSFAGGGGASTGIRAAIGREIDVAINHSPTAVAMHTANHPTCVHYCQDVWKAEPAEVAAGRPVGLAWFSPDCRHFSKAKGGAPASKQVRDLAWVVVAWARAVKPRVMMLENVEEFRTWGPLLEDGTPCPARAGTTFRRWVREIEREGYAVEWRELRACDYGAPTSRKRLFVIARCDGEPIQWPSPTHGPGLLPHRTAAECIDWSIPVRSIFGREKPLADATLRRIAHGVMRHVVNAERPFIVSLTHHGSHRTASIDEPFRTITAANRGELGLVAPTLVQMGYGERPGQAPRVPGLDKPLGTVVAGGLKHGLVSAFLSGCGGRAAQSPPKSVQLPMNTMTTKADQILVAAFMAQHNTGVVGHPIDKPLSTITSAGTQQQPVLATLSEEDREGAERVTAFLIKFYGTAMSVPVTQPFDTVTTKARFGLVMCQGLPIVDIGMRMLVPRELYRAQGFPADYAIDVPGPDGRTLSKTDQIKCAGNSVCPPLAEALVRANLGDASTTTRRAA